MKKKMMIVVMALFLSISGCEEFRQVMKTTLPVVMDIAVQLCRLAASEHPDTDLGGMSVDEWCDCADNVAPFLAAAEDAKAAGAKMSGMSK